MIRAGNRPILVLTGVLGGAISGLVGGGGGAVMIPLMTGVLKMRQHVAHGTSLVIIVGAATAAALTYWAQGSIDWPLVAFLVVGSTVGAVIGARQKQSFTKSQINYRWTNNKINGRPFAFLRRLCFDLSHAFGTCHCPTSSPQTKAKARAKPTHTKQKSYFTKLSIR